MVQVKNLNKSFGSQQIFEWAELHLWKKEIAGLVGVNWSGKTTLFKILSWEDEEFEWTISHDSAFPLIWYMKQQMSIEAMNISVLDFMKQYTGMDVIEKRLDDLINDLNDPEKFEEYWEVYEMFEKMWGYEFEHKIEKLLNQIGLWKYWLESTIDAFSWWEKRKLLLCGTLIKWWDLLLLDEPTNDLDASSIEWLVSFLKESIASCLIVSHDKAFLNDVVRKIFEINDKSIVQYSGNYDFYEKAKLLAYQQSVDAYERQTEEEIRIKKVAQEIKQKASSIGNRWNIRDNDKWDWAAKVEKKLAKAAKSIQNRVNRMEKVEKPKVKKPIQLHFMPSEEPLWWIHIEDLAFSYAGNKTFNLTLSSLTISSEDKLLISWWNGGGKSTFLKLLIGELSPDSWLIKKHSSLNIWYFSQEQESLPRGVSPLHFLNGQLWFDVTDVHAVLGSMWFDDEDKQKNIELLSPGMRLRLTFALLALKNCNCLIFDEPTNHIDVEIKEALKKALNEFTWMLIVVSHDTNFTHDIDFSKKIAFHEWIGMEQ